MVENIKFLLAVLIGSGVTYGTVQTEIKYIKQQLQDHSKHAERLAAIEAKVDFIISYLKKP